MSHGPTKIKSKGACIYCGRSDVILTDEHIVPLFIGGQHVIEKGSCVRCARITSRFELDVGRKLWGDARTSYNAPSRRKKKRASHITLTHSAGPGITLPYPEYPAPMVFYRMDTAGILAGFPNDLDRSKIWTLEAIADDKKIAEFEDKYPGRLTGKFFNVPDSFARMLIKIGYGQVLTSLDPADFDAICVPYILGKERNLSHIVGARRHSPPPFENTGYHLLTCCVGTTDQLVLVAEVRLVANCQTPIYHVVVGTAQGTDRVSAIHKKLDGAESVTITNETTFKPTLDDVLHWMPRSWPMKL